MLMMKDSALVSRRMMLNENISSIRSQQFWAEAKQANNRLGKGHDEVKNGLHLNPKSVKVTNSLFREDFAMEHAIEKSLETDEDRPETKLQKFMNGDRQTDKQNTVFRNCFIEPAQRRRSRKPSQEQPAQGLDDTLIEQEANQQPFDL